MINLEDLSASRHADKLIASSGQVNLASTKTTTPGWRASDWGIGVGPDLRLSRSLSRMSTAVLVYDDHDTSISYSNGHWGQAGVIEEFKSTTSWTIHKGATANLTFSGNFFTHYVYNEMD